MTNDFDCEPLVVSGVRDFSLRHFVGPQVDEHSPVPQTHRADGRFASVVQRAGTEHRRRCTVSRDLLLYLQSDQRSFELLWVSLLRSFDTSDGT